MPSFLVRKYQPRTSFFLSKVQEVDLAEKELFTPILNEAEEMQSILVATLNKLKD